MLDPAKPTPLNLKDSTTYVASCIALAQERLQAYESVADIAHDETALNQYPRLDALRPPRGVMVLDDLTLAPADLDQARQALLRGEVLLEHACAGEATRLGLGPKYLLQPGRDLTYEVLTRLGLGKLPIKPSALTGMTLGRRHMLQLAWDLGLLAQEAGLPPETVLYRQWLLVTVGENWALEVIDDFRQAEFYGFDPAKVLFMVQRGFHGLALRGGGWVYDMESARRLHNHGQMLMQSTMDRQLFYMDDNTRRHLSWDDYRQLLAGFVDKVSFNIEDLDYLQQALDLPGLALALRLGGHGYRMVMETVANNPTNPQKGGSLSWDPELGRNVMIESFQLKGVQNKDIVFLNKNVNHYPSPAAMAQAVRQMGLSMPITVKQDHLYFQPVQGDVNFLVPTAFVRRHELRPISAWKSAAETAEALKAMLMQDRRPGFLAWAENLTGLRLQNV